MRVIVGETPRAHEYRCYLDGEDISDWCVAADDEEGWADCYARNAEGKTYLDSDGQVARAPRRFGVVRLEIPTDGEESE